MADEQVTANPFGSESAEPSTSLDDPANLNFMDPDDDQDNQDDESEPESADETDETPEDGDQEAEPTDEDEEGDSEEAEDDESEATDDDPDSVVVTLQGGEQVPLKELKAGYMKDRDYRHKTTALSEKSKALEDMTTRVTKSVDAIVDFLTKQIPDAPEPSLAMTNPGEYVRQKAMYEASMSQINAIIEQANAPKEVAESMTKEQRAERVNSEFAKLAEAFPTVAKPEGRQKFFDNAASAARDLGYSDEEIKGVDDHRMFKMAHYARLGLEAEKAKAKSLKKVENVPPVKPVKRQAGTPAAKVRANQDAVKRLSQTGSIHDAMRIDFD